MSARTRRGMPGTSLLSMLTVAVEDEMRELWAELRNTLPFYDWIEYHLGWRDLPGTGRARPGKHIRSLLLLLVGQMFGGTLGQAVPLAAAVELLHSATLVFDDLQDGSARRRGRPALWQLAGAGQAINAGAALQASVNVALVRAHAAGLSAAATLDAMEELGAAMLRLAEGQYLDLRLHGADEPGLDQYMDLCARKAAWLFASAAALGVLAAGRADLADPARRLGHHLGMYLQISDDIDGIWGDPEVTGKPVDDVAAKRKTLPVLYAFRRVAREPGAEDPDGLRERFFGPEPLAPGDLEACMDLLDRCEAREYAVTVAHLHAEGAQQACGELQAHAAVPGALTPLFAAFSEVAAAGRLGAALRMPAQPARDPAAQMA